jgi:uncharacterized protein YhfF
MPAGLLAERPEVTLSPRLAAFWRRACDAVAGLPRDAACQVWHFGDGEALARELADLVLHGRKRATAGLLWDAEDDPNATPVPGGYSLVTDFAGAPLMILRTSQVETRRFGDVDAGFAAAEAEGDGSLASWRAGHWDYFSRRCEAIGRVPSEDMPVLLERFDLIYPVRP